MRAILAVMAAGLLWSCGSSTPATLAEADENISNFNASGEYITMRLQFDSAPTPGNFAPQLEEAIGNVAEAVASGAAGGRPESKFVAFDIRTGAGEFPDRFGNYRFDLSSFTDASGAPRSGSAVLNAVKNAETGSGDMVPEFVRWCSDGSEQARRLSRFCDRVAGAWATRG